VWGQALFLAYLIDKESSAGTPFVQRAGRDLAGASRALLQTKLFSMRRARSGSAIQQSPPHFCGSRG